MRVTKIFNKYVIIEKEEQPHINNRQQYIVFTKTLLSEYKKVNPVIQLAKKIWGLLTVKSKQPDHNDGRKRYENNLKNYL
jgi:hypothetical protein